MYACLHVPGPDVRAEELFHLALEFSPVVERTSGDTVVFCIDPLRKLIGSPHQIASEISRHGYERNLQANLAIAANPDTAILLAQNFTGVMLVTPGEEGLKLGPIPLARLATQEMLDILRRWGIKTCEDLAALPERGVAERLGSKGIYLRNLARGKIDRPLSLPANVTSYEERMDLEHPVSLLEPLLFLLGRVLGELCGRLRAQSRAARLLAAKLQLEDAPEYQCELEFPVPLDNSQTILKLLQLHLERHSPNAPVIAFLLRVTPDEPRRVQEGFFLPPTPPADKLQITLARIRAMVGEENAGTPLLLNTHRPDAFTMTTLNTASLKGEEHPAENSEIRLAMRLFRPALQADVKLLGASPKTVIASGVKGNVLKSAGPWKTSGEWWAATSWSREEWDVALDDGALYRIYQQLKTRDWYVHAVYD